MVRVYQLEHPKIAEQGVVLEDLQRIDSASKRSRFTLRQLLGTSAVEDPTAYQVRRKLRRNSVGAGAGTPALIGEPFTLETEDLPEFLVYETTYQAYPLIVASGGIKRAAGTTHLSFSAVTPDKMGNEAADVSIWIDLRAALEATPEIRWQRTETGTIAANAEEVPKALWSKAVARRPDVGVLFEDGEARREVTEALKKGGAKGKGRKGKGEESLQSRAVDEDSSEGSASSEE